jgi:hypothetical protein
MSIISHEFSVSEWTYFIVSSGFDRYPFRRMIKALLLIFEPIEAWERVVRAQRSLVFILILFLLPLLGATSLVKATACAMGKGGKTLHLKQFTSAEAAVYEIGKCCLRWAPFLGAKFIKSLGDTFHGRHSLTQTFTTVAYGLSPLFTMRLFDAFPESIWVTWTSILLSLAVLYQECREQCNPTLAFGLYIVSVLLLILITGLLRFVTAWYKANSNRWRKSCKFNCYDS